MHRCSSSLLRERMSAYWISIKALERQLVGRITAAGLELPKWRSYAAAFGSNVRNSCRVMYSGRNHHIRPA